MLDEYIFYGNRRLRRGYTTGSCAAAAAKAAAEMLLTGERVSRARIVTPKGIVLDLEILDAVLGTEYASCAVRKDGGDDPDVTDGILVYARAERGAAGIEICGGEGVGTVTKAGLDQPVGAAAINSVPRKMIAAAVEEICEKHDHRGGVKITVYVPGGAELARKTYNPRMGIEGGISIIGTTGIVEPMSTDAIIGTIRAEASMRRAEGLKNMLLTIGNYGENFLGNFLPNACEKSVKCSNFIGEAIDIGLEMGFERILIVGHVGKLVKLGAGIMNTHSAQADGRMDVLVTCGVLADADTGVLKKIPECATVDAAIAVLDEAGAREKTVKILMERAQFYLDAKVKNEVKIGAVMFSERYGIIGETPSAGEIRAAISEEYNG